MPTRGYKVYRHKGRYFLYHNMFDSYPDCFGVDVLREIPRNVSKAKFEKWVKAIQEYLDSPSTYEKMNNAAPDADDYMTDKQPDQKSHNHVSYIYEIDLDNLIFHVNAQPMFRLDNMPPSDIFIKSISYDHFGHMALREHTPVQFRYDRRIPPPPPFPESLAAYNSCHNRSSTSSVHDLLSIPAALSSIERVRTALVGVLVTRCMTGYGVAHQVRTILEGIPNRDHIPRSMRRLALSLVNFAVGPPIPSMPCTPLSSMRDFIWIRKDVCLRITTHLDDTDNLRASIGDLVHYINAKPDVEGTIYGIGCSIFHCVVVRVDKDVGGTSFAHTPALQLLPSFFARKISTPGIEALSRLGCQYSGVEFLTAISDAYNLPRITHESFITDSVVAKVPIEVWTRIGDFITSPVELVSLASISPRAMSAAASLARYPSVLEFRLLDVVGSVPQIPETTEDTKDEDIERYFYELGRAKFTAVEGGRRVDVELGQEPDSWSAGHHQDDITFKVQSYLPSSVVVTNKKLYVLEVDDEEVDDDKATDS